MDGVEGANVLSKLNSSFLVGKTKLPPCQPIFSPAIFLYKFDLVMKLGHKKYIYIVSPG